MAVFMTYFPRFWGYSAIYDDRKTRYMFESYYQKLVVFMFYGHFMRYCPEFCDSMGICVACYTRLMFESYDQKIIIFTFYEHFYELLPTVLGQRGDVQRP